jgi:hypothetical protein
VGAGKVDVIMALDLRAFCLLGGLPTGTIIKKHIEIM